MKKLVSLMLAATFLISASAFAAKGYQVTGQVVEVTPTKMVIQKGKEKWELARSAGTKVVGDLKVGNKVTAYYSMTATDVEVRNIKKPEAK